MKILVYGAGVLGCNLARNLFHAGKDVTLLARENWAEEIRKNGLRIKDQFSLRTSVSNIPVVTELAPNVRYDVIFVVLRYTQLDSALETLQANQPLHRRARHIILGVVAEHGDDGAVRSVLARPIRAVKAIAFNIKVDVFHSKRFFQKLIFTICIFIIPSPTLARKRKKPPMEGSFKSL